MFKHGNWGDIWKHTVAKSQTNATNVTLHTLMQVIRGDIWKHTVAKSQRNATNVTMHPLMQALWWHIWKHTIKTKYHGKQQFEDLGTAKEMWMHILKNITHIWFWQKAGNLRQSAKQMQILTNITHPDYDAGKRAQSFHYDKWYWQLRTTAHNF